MAIEILILGDGTGGIVTANLLARQVKKSGLSINIRLIGNSPLHTYQPGLLFMPFQTHGYQQLADIQKPTAPFISPGVSYRVEQIEAIDPQHRSVTTQQSVYHYDWLVIALGCRTLVDDVPGLREHWGKTAHGFYTPNTAMALAQALQSFQGGNLVVDVAEMPIKCPVAPLEFACLVDDYLEERGLRGKTKITYVTPLSGAFTKPVCNEALTGMLHAKGIEVIANSSLAEVRDGAISCPDGREIPFDLLVAIPPHEGSDLVNDAGLGDGLGFGLTEKFTLKSKVSERIFLLGDITNLPTSKAGSVAHYQAEVVVHNLFREITAQAAEPIADGHATCFIETGHHKAVLIDFNYDTQPVSGNFPLPMVGPMSLLKETYLNHLGKLAFKSAYWHMLLPGHPIPLVGSQMSRMGKHLETLPQAA